MAYKTEGSIHRFMISTYPQVQIWQMHFSSTVEAFLESEAAEDGFLVSVDFEAVDVLVCIIIILVFSATFGNKNSYLIRITI